MTPVTIDLQDAVRGDKWQGIATIGPVTVNGVTPSFPLSRVRMQFRKQGVLGLTVDSDDTANPDSPIEILDADLWIASIPAIQPLPLSPGEWDWDMEFFEGNDTAPQTYYKGVLTVTQDQSR